MRIDELILFLFITDNVTYSITSRLICVQIISDKPRCAIRYFVSQNNVLEGD